MSARMNNDETLVPDHSEGYESSLAIVLTVVDTRQNLTFEHLSGMEQIDATLTNDLNPLALIPLKIHLV
ncbi:MAG: hypothetical protein Rhirs2KO_08520 [Rhizobiaceae bacterium]